jgi:hypothetical protein
MCSICKPTFPDFEVEHTEIRCPFRMSRYCSYCAQYGHLTKACPAKPAKIFREPAFKEQLEPYESIKTTTTRTPILYIDSPQKIIELKDTEENIVAYLQNEGIKIKPKKNAYKEQLEDYVKISKKRLVYM